MLTGTCHCGAVRVEVPRRPRMLTSCKCSICRRYGALWAYYRAADVRIVSKRGATDSYSWGRKALKFVRCATCGCVMNWERKRPRKENYMGVNARNLEPAALDGVRIRLLDGADTCGWAVGNSSGRVATGVAPDSGGASIAGTGSARAGWAVADTMPTGMTVAMTARPNRRRRARSSATVPFLL